VAGPVTLFSRRPGRLFRITDLILARRPPDAALLAKPVGACRPPSAVGKLRPGPRTPLPVAPRRAFSSARPVVQSEDNSGSTRVSRQGRTDTENLGPGAVNESQQATAGEHKQRVERRYSRGKSEIITVAQLVSKKVQTGTQRNSLGGATPVYGTRMVEGGKLRIEMTDDVVTAVEGVQY
jgi:hypothetical protein